jgi:transposase
MNEWPASVPDFNPIEQVWRSLKQCLSQRGPWLQGDDLKAALLKEYNKLP